MHFDDVHFLWKMREYSIFKYVREMYMSRGGNFVSYGLNGIIFTLSNRIGSYRFWAKIFYMLGICMTWLAFSDMSFIKKSGWRGWLGVITLYNVYILTSVDYAVFTWMCAMEYYLFAPALCMLIKYFAKESLNWSQWVIMMALAIFISGNAVSISTISFVVMFAYGMYLWYNERWNVCAAWAKPQVRRLIGVTVLMLVCFAIVFVAPGNWSRLEDGNDMQHPETIMEFGMAIVKCVVMFLYMMAFYLPYHLIAVAFGAWAGIHYPMELQISRKKALSVIVIVAIVYLLVCVVPLAYLSNGFGIQRNYIQIGFFYILTFYVLGYLITCQSKFGNKKCISVLTYTCTIFLIVIMVLNIRQDLPVARAYNKAHQERESYLLSLQDAGNKETIVVVPYPSTHTTDAKYNVLRWIGKKSPMQAIYYESDTDVQPNEYEGHIRKLLKLDFDFVLAEPKKKE